jgi:hypothetical protein
MKRHFLILLLSAATSRGAVYVNTFDSPAALNGFTIYGEPPNNYNPPPLHTVNVSGGQLVIQTTSFNPNGPGVPPSLSGSATLSLKSALTFGPGYHSVLSQNSAPVAWSFNVANQDGAFNNDFFFVLASTLPNPYDIGAHGYYFKGGGMVGNRMGLWRFDLGLGGGQSVLIDVIDGLAPLPQQGSFRITYNPANNQWNLFGAMDTSYQDPTQVGALLGAATDGTYTGQSAPYLALGGNSTGTDYFDNVVVQVPEPGTGLWCLGSAAFLWWARKRRTNGDA